MLNHPPICGNASSQAAANRCPGLRVPASILNTVEAAGMPSVTPYMRRKGLLWSCMVMIAKFGAEEIEK